MENVDYSLLLFLCIKEGGENGSLIYVEHVYTSDMVKPGRWLNPSLIRGGGKFILPGSQAIHIKLWGHFEFSYLSGC